MLQNIQLEKISQETRRMPVQSALDLYVIGTDADAKRVRASSPGFMGTPNTVVGQTPLAAMFIDLGEII